MTAGDILLWNMVKNEKVEMVMKNDNLSKHAMVFPFECICLKRKSNEMMCLYFFMARCGN